jgi:hypothetical protein
LEPECEGGESLKKERFLADKSVIQTRQLERNFELLKLRTGETMSSKVCDKVVAT